MRHMFPAVVIPPAPAGMSKAHHATHVVDGLCCEAGALMTAAIDFCGNGPNELDALPQVKAVFSALEKLHEIAEAAHRKFECSA